MATNDHIKHIVGLISVGRLFQVHDCFPRDTVCLAAYFRTFNGMSSIQHIEPFQESEDQLVISKVIQD